MFSREGSSGISSVYIYSKILSSNYKTSFLSYIFFFTNDSSLTLGNQVVHGFGKWQQKSLMISPVRIGWFMYLTTPDIPREPRTSSTWNWWEISHFRVGVASVSRRVFVSNLSHGNEFFFRVYCLANKTHFDMKCGAAGLILNVEVNCNSEMAYCKR